MREDAYRKIIHFGDLSIGTHSGERLDFASGEVTKESEPSIGKRTRVARSPILGIWTSEVREGSPSNS
jgi:hypothetical protein